MVKRKFHIERGDKKIHCHQTPLLKVSVHWSCRGYSEFITWLEQQRAHDHISLAHHELKNQGHTVLFHPRENKLNENLGSGWQAKTHIGPWIATPVPDTHAKDDDETPDEMELKGNHLSSWWRSTNPPAQWTAGPAWCTLCGTSLQQGANSGLRGLQSDATH